METTELERVFDEVRALPPDQKARVAEALSAMIAQLDAAPGKGEAMRDPRYAAYVESALDEAETDRLAGRVEPLEPALDRMLNRFKTMHGL